MKSSTLLCTEMGDSVGTSEGCLLGAHQVASTCFQEHTESAEKVPKETGHSQAAHPSEKPAGEANVLPFLLHNLDTGETTVLEEEWNT